MLIAIGDLHGHYAALDQLLRALQERGGVFLSRSSDRLRKGVKLVVTGDYIDRGRHALAIVERLRKLSECNPERVVCLLGNHELMALEDYDDAAAIWRHSGGTLSQRALTAYAKVGIHGDNGGDEFVREFGSMESYVKRMASTGDIGGWIRALRPAYKGRVAGRTVLFMHGDLSAELRDKRVLDGRIAFIDQRRKLSSLDAGGTRSKWGHPRLKSFFWSRSFGKLENAAPADVAALCREVDVDFIVTGHTIHRSIKVYGGRIFDIDVGMSPRCGGNPPRALLIQRSGISSLGTDGREKKLVPFSV